MRLERSFSPATLTRGTFRTRQGNEPRRVTMDSNQDCKRQSRVASAMRHTPTSSGVRLRRQTLTRLEDLLKASIEPTRENYSRTIVRLLSTGRNTLIPTYSI